MKNNNAPSSLLRLFLLTGLRSGSLTVARSVRSLLAFLASAGIAFQSAHAVDASPEIDVQLSSRSFASGTKVTFGTVARGESVTKTVTVKNTGTAALNLNLNPTTGLAISGTAAADYSLDITSTSAIVAPGSNTTFNVTFAPSAVASRPASLRIVSDDANEGTYTLPLEGSGATPTPKIDLQVVSNVSLANTTGSINFGAVTGGTTLAKTVRIVNKSSTTSLRVDSISLSGDGALTGEYVLDTSHTDDAEIGADGSLPTTIPAGGVATFGLTFSPSLTDHRGQRPALLTVASSDLAVPSYKLSIIGTNTNPALISFSTSNYQVNQGTGSMNLVLTRDVANLSQTVQVTTADGTSLDSPPFQPASAGSDYVALNAFSVTFGVGKKTVNVPVKLMPKTGSVPNRRFTAAITSLPSGSLPGTIMTSTVQVLATDTIKPTLDVTSPDENITSYDGGLTASISVTGTATDAYGISKVEVRLNTDAPVSIPLTAPDSGTPTTWPFSYTVSTVLGVNKLSITAFDLRGNKTIVNRTYTVTGGQDFSITRSIPLNMTGKADSVGKVAMVVSPTNRGTSLTPTTANAVTRTCKVLPGAAVTLTATASNGFTFSHWTGVPLTGTTTLGNQVRILSMPSSSVAISAVFVANVFNNGTDGSSFYGNLTEDSPALATYNNNAFVTLNITTSSGAFSGSVTVGGATSPINGTFYADGYAIFRLSASSQANFFTLPGDADERYLMLHYDTSGKRSIDAVLVIPSETPGGEVIDSEGTLYRAKHSASNKVSSSLLNQTTKGYYTFAIANDSTVSPTSLPTSAHPEGFGYGSLSLSNLGAISMSGTLADGTTFSATTAITTASGYAPFYSKVTVAGQPKGVFSGYLVFDSTNPNTDVTAVCHWIRPSTASGAYTAGWENGFYVDLFGSLYSTTRTAALSLGLPAANTTTGNAGIEFFSAKLASTVYLESFNIIGSTVNNLNTDALSLTITSSTGLFIGGFTPNWASPSSTKPTFKGMILQKSEVGYGYFMSNATGDANPKSGRVTLADQNWF